MAVGRTAPDARVARFVATVPLSVGTQRLGVDVTPVDAEQVDEKQTFEGLGAWSHAPVPSHVPPHAPTEHVVPLGAGGLEQAPTPPSPTEQVPATWHASDATQAMGLPPEQVPFWQACPAVHAFPPEQGVPFGAAGFEHAPVDGSHVPLVEQGPDAVQTTGLLPTHVPFWQVSVWVQALESEHAVPLAAVGFEHTPVAGSQVPWTKHCPAGAHVTGGPPTQVPL
jgi:hypothetical protein